MKITFKNVGQGDSIILEWEDEGTEKIAIIDCNNDCDVNPVLEYFKTTTYPEISFLLLSHPHTDHFSGFSGLLDYCIDRKIPIKYFLHTANNMPSFWKAAVCSKEAETKLLQLFHLLRKAKDTIGLKYHAIQGETLNSEIGLGQWKFKVLAPTSNELDNYARNSVTNFTEEEHGNKPSANWLATFVKLYKDDNYILLTSDVSKTALIYYDKNHPDEFAGNLILGQSPHHGSARNHNNTFWRKRSNNIKGIPIVFSVGSNIYDHPSLEAVGFFRSNGFKIFSTNEVGALASQPTPSTKKVMSALNTFSRAISIKQDALNGDKIFSIDDSGRITAS